MALTRSRITWHGACNSVGTMKNTTMKSALYILMLVLGAGSAAAAFAGIAGFVPSSAFFSSEVAFSLYGAAGMCLIGLNDCGCRTSTKHLA